MYIIHTPCELVIIYIHICCLLLNKNVDLSAIKERNTILGFNIFTRQIGRNNMNK